MPSSQSRKGTEPSPSKAKPTASSHSNNRPPAPFKPTVPRLESLTQSSQACILGEKSGPLVKSLGHQRDPNRTIPLLCSKIWDTASLESSKKHKQISLL